MAPDLWTVDDLPKFDSCLCRVIQSVQSNPVLGRKGWTTMSACQCQCLPINAALMQTTWTSFDGWHHPSVLHLTKHFILQLQSADQWERFQGLPVQVSQLVQPILCQVASCRCRVGTNTHFALILGVLGKMYSVRIHHTFEADLARVSAVHAAAKPKGLPAESNMPCC